MEENDVTLRRAVREMEFWKKQLVHLEQENSSQKNKLVMLLRNNDGDASDLLEIAENFQNQFLQQDETFRLMRNDLTKLAKSVVGQTVGDDHRQKEIKHWQKKLRREMKLLDVNFDDLRKGFARFLGVYFPGD